LLASLRQRDPGNTLGRCCLAPTKTARLRYVGKVGTGFNEETLASLYKTFQPLIRSKPALVDPPRERNVSFLKTRLVAQISYQEWTADRKLRQPVFLGLRDDKRPEEVVLPEPSR
jgi:ATP-dependent DNA ligase